MLMELISTYGDKETFTDSSNIFDTVNKIELAYYDKNECEISNMWYEYINTSVALPCNHDSEFDSLCAPDLMYVHNNLGSLPKMYSSLVNYNLLNRGFVNIFDVCQNVQNQVEFEQINMPYNTEADVISQHCDTFDNDSKVSSYTADRTQNASNQLTCHMGNFGSPTGDPVGVVIHNPIHWGHKHRVDVFKAKHECGINNLTLIFVHPSIKDDLLGWYYLSVATGSNISLFSCNWVPQGSLSVSHTMDMYFIGFADNLQLSPNNAYQDYLKDHQISTYYNMSYTTYMENIVDMLIGQADCVEPSSSDVVNTISFNDPVVTPPDMVEINSYQPEGTRVNTDNNCLDKSRGFLNHSEANFTFIGPDREPVLISDIDQCVAIAKLIQETGKPNYTVARIPLVSDLNLEVWQRHLADYHDKYLFQYLKFGFPLSLSNPSDLNDTCVVNHASALQYPQAIKQYLDKECEARGSGISLCTYAY